MVEDMFIRFDRVHERDRQTNGRTDTARRHRPRLCIASRGKNWRDTTRSVVPNKVLEYDKSVYSELAFTLLFGTSVAQQVFFIIQSSRLTDRPTWAATCNEMWWEGWIQMILHMACLVKRANQVRFWARIMTKILKPSRHSGKQWKMLCGKI